MLEKIGQSIDQKYNLRLCVSYEYIIYIKFDVFSEVFVGVLKARSEFYRVSIRLATC